MNEGGSSSSGTEVGSSKELGFRQRLSLGSDSRVSEKNAHRLELSSLGSRGSGVVRSDTSSISPDSGGNCSPQNSRAKNLNAHDDFHSIEFS